MKLTIKKQKKKFKKSCFSFVDMLATKKVIDARITNVQNTELKPIKTNYNVNELANHLHPKMQILKVDEIINLTPSVKQIKLVSTTNKNIAIFRPGQYINIQFDIVNTKINRPYSIASSLKEAYESNYYLIAIKNKTNGFVSKYVHNELKIGDIVISNDPSGEFYYSKLRDAKDIIAIVGGIGITPIYSIAKWINDYNIDINLTILYSNSTEQEIVYKNELESLSKINNKIKIHYFITQQKNNNYKNHRISMDDIKQIYNYLESSYFICGPKRFVLNFKDVLLKNGIKKKFIRLETNNELSLSNDDKTYINKGNKDVYRVKIKNKDDVFYIDASKNETLFSSIQRANIPIKSSCLSGKCSLCRVRLVSGEVYTQKESACYRQSDYINKIIYTCSVFPITDLEIDML